MASSMALLHAGRAVERGQHREPRAVEHEVLARTNDDVARVTILRDPDVALQDDDPAAGAVLHPQRTAGLQVETGHEVAEVHGLLLDTCCTCIYVERLLAEGQTVFPHIMNAL